MSDPIDQVLDEISQHLSACESAATKARLISKVYLEEASEFLGRFAAPDGPLAELFALDSEIIAVLTTMTFDVQVTIAEGYLTKSLSKQALPKIAWSDGDLSFLALPVGAPTIMLGGKPGVNRPNFPVLRSLWGVSIGNGAVERREAYLEFKLKLRGHGEQVKIVPSRSIRFSDNNGRSVDLLSAVPFGKGLRLQVRREIRKQVNDAVAGLDIKFPTSDVPLPLQLIPLTSFAHGALFLVYKLGDLPKRRASYALSQFIPYAKNDLYLRIKSDVIIRQLGTVVSQIEGASIENPRFSGNRFLFTVKINRTERQCIAKAKIRAWIEYITYIEKRGQATLGFLARQNGWQASWEIDWCFHKCGEASDLIRKTLHTEIPKYKEQRAMLGDFSTIAREAGGWTDAFGLNITLESK